MTTLGEFEGSEIVATPIIIRKTGDGLSKSLAIDPVLLHKGDEVYVVMKVKITKITFRENGDDDTKLDRVADGEAVLCTLVEEKAVAKSLAAQAKKLEQAKQLKGQLSMDDDESGE